MENKIRISIIIAKIQEALEYLKEIKNEEDNKKATEEVGEKRNQ